MIDFKGGKSSEDKAIDECKITENATDEDVKRFLSDKLPQSRVGKCLTACVLEKTGEVMMIKSLLTPNFFSFH